MPTCTILVGFTTKAREDVVVPEFSGTKGTKDADKIAAQIAEKQNEFLSNCNSMPYVGQLSEVVLLDVSRQQMARFPTAAPDPAAKKKTKTSATVPDPTPIAVQISRWLTRQWPNAWSQDVLQRDKAQVVFAGFNPRRFIKMLAIECAEAFDEHGNILPAGLWFGSSDYRDIESAVLPEGDCKGLPLSLALEKLKIPNSNDFVPGVDPERDTLIGFEIMMRLGLVVRANGS